MTGATYFTKLDVKNDYWQIPIAKESTLLTTFLTPYRRYYFNKLLFSISSAPESFHKRMNPGLEGALCLVDDVLVFGANLQEHDKCVNAVMQRLQNLNLSKCVFLKDQVKFMAYIQANSENVSTIVKMKAPSNVTELRRLW